MKPVPDPSPLTAGYWEAAARGQLAIQRCEACRQWIHLPQPWCPSCGGRSLAYEPVSGRGVVHTFTVVHRTFVPGFETPYAVGWIDLPEQEGLRAFGNVVGDVEIGAPVEVWFDELPGFGPIPQWRVT